MAAPSFLGYSGRASTLRWVRLHHVMKISIITIRENYLLSFITHPRPNRSRPIRYRPRTTSLPEQHAKRPRSVRLPSHPPPASNPLLPFEGQRQPRGVRLRREHRQRHCGSSQCPHEPGGARGRQQGSRRARDFGAPYEAQQVRGEPSFAYGWWLKLAFCWSDARMYATNCGVAKNTCVFERRSAGGRVEMAKHSR